MHRVSRTGVCVVLSTVLLLATGATFAQTPPDPIGLYDLGAVEDDGGATVAVELRLRLFQPGSEPLEIAGVAIADSIRSAVDLATLPGFTLEPRVPLDRTEHVTIERAEYELWRRGARPKLRILDADGQRTGGRIELTRRPLGEGW